VSLKEVTKQIKELNERLIAIHEMLEKRESTRTEYSILTIFAAFIPVFLFMLSYFGVNPHSTEYFITLAFLMFFAGTSFVWAMIQVAKAKTPFTYSLTFLLPLFIIFLPLLWAVLVTLNVLPVITVFRQVSIAIICIYAAVFFVYFAIELMYRKLIVRNRS